MYLEHDSILYENVYLDQIEYKYVTLDLCSMDCVHLFSASMLKYVTYGRYIM